MHIKAFFSAIILCTASCKGAADPAPASSGDSDPTSTIEPATPISAEAGAWIFHDASISENTCGPDSMTPDDLIPLLAVLFDVAIDQGSLSMTFGRSSATCEYTGNDFTCAKLTMKGHYGYEGDDDEHWEPDLEWHCSDCSGSDLASAETIRGVPVRAPQGVCYDEATRTTSITLSDDCASMVWTSFTDDADTQPFERSYSVSGTLRSSTSLDMSVSTNIVCRDGESERCDEWAASGEPYLAIPCVHVIAGVGIHCGPRADAISEECAALAEASDQAMDDANTGDSDDPDDTGWHNHSDDTGDTGAHGNSDD